MVTSIIIMIVGVKNETLSAESIQYTDTVYGCGHANSWLMKVHTSCYFHVINGRMCIQLLTIRRAATVVFSEFFFSFVVLHKHR